MTQSSNYGKATRSNDFFNFSVVTRFNSGLRLGGGVDMGRSVIDDCIPADPSLATALFFNTERTHNAHRVYCRVITPLKGTAEVKLNGSYQFPGQVVVAAIYQNVAAPTIEANYPAPTALAKPTLGRDLAGGTKTVTVPLIRPNTLFEKRRTQVDLRLTKIFRVGARVRLQANLDAYNVMNANSILTRNNTFGSTWGRPGRILDARLIQFGGQLNF